MIAVKATIGQEPYKIEIKSATGNILIADEPIAKGGQDQGFSPKELLASALAACTCATVRMYAERKEWAVLDVHVSIALLEEEGKTTFKRDLKFDGVLSDEQRKRLLNVANACPIHKILSGTIAIETQVID